MLANQFIENSFPVVHANDKVFFALQLMDDYEVMHLPVVSNEKYVGLIGKDDLLDANEQTMVIALEDVFVKASVLQDAFLLEIIKIFAQKEISLLPVVNPQHEIIGTINTPTLIKAIDRFLGNEERGGVIVLEIDRRHYSFGEISRLVETNDAYITQLNTQVNTQTGLTTICLKLNRIEISDIIATFQRYDYNILHYFGEEQFANTLKDNYQHLMAYLNI